jgi:sulfate adenylyltransferase
MALIEPHGGHLVERLDAGAERLGAATRRLVLDEGPLSELENIAIGVLSPLTGFMSADVARRVAETGRLPDGLGWTLPILLPVPADEPPFARGDHVALLSAGENGAAGYLAGYLEVEEDFVLPADSWAPALFGTDDPAHPGLARVRAQSGRYLAGPVVATRIRSLPGRATPRETRALFESRGWQTVAAFQTRNAPHLGHEFVQKTAALWTDGLFVQPVLGQKKAGDFRDEVIIAAYELLFDHYFAKDRAALGTLAYEMRYAGPKEAIHHAIMRKNHGCSHLCVGRDHAGVGSYYGPYDAQRIFASYPDLGIAPIPVCEVHRCLVCDGVVASELCPHKGDDIVSFSGTKVRRILTEEGASLDGLVRPEIAELVRSFPEPLVTA